MIKEKHGSESAEAVKDLIREIGGPLKTISGLVDILEGHLENNKVDSVTMNHYNICKDAFHELNEYVSYSIQAKSTTNNCVEDPEATHFLS